MTNPHPYTKDNNSGKTAGNNDLPEKNSFQDSIRPLAEGGSTLANHIKEDTAELARLASNEAGREFRNLKSYTADTLKGLEKEIISKPVQSIAIAFASGAFLSLLLGRR